MKFDERLEGVLQDLGEVQWDVIVFTETWREEVQEIFETKYGHTWFGSGGVRGGKGVGILVNSRWGPRTGGRFAALLKLILYIYICVFYCFVFLITVLFL